MEKGQSGWGRPQVNIRLTARRAQMLRRVSNSAPGADTPQRAFDRALELASAALDESAASGERLAEVEAAVRELAIARSSDTEGLREQLAGIAESLENLRALIAEVAAGD